MPYEADDQQRVDDAIREAEGSTKLLIRDPTESQKLGPFTVMCTIWNRTIGLSFNITMGEYFSPLFNRRVRYLRDAGYNSEEHEQRWCLPPALGIRCHYRNVCTSHLVGIGTFGPQVRPLR